MKMMDAWEQSKENVLPVKAGRSVSDLNENLQKLHSAAAEQDRATTIKGFENKIAKLQKVQAEQSGDDTVSGREILDVYIQYFKYVRSAYPSSKEKALTVLEKCTLDLKDNETLKNDVRFVKLWIEYADLVQQSHEVFSFMNSSKIGSKVSLFWMAWAFVAEKAGNFKGADAIYNKGISRRDLDNREALQKRYQHFQRRLARALINSTGGNAEGVDSNSHYDNLDLMSRQLQQQQQQSQPALTAQSSLTNRSDRENSSSMANRSLSSASTSRSGTLGASSASIRPAGSSLSSSSSSMSSNRGLKPTSTTNSFGGVGFAIFSDSATASQPAELYDPSDPNSVATSSMGLSTVTENPNWTSLGSTKDRIKENQGPVTKWNAGPLVAPSTTSSTSTLSGRPPRPGAAPVVPTAAPQMSFTIFSDVVENSESSSDAMDIDDQPSHPTAALSSSSSSASTSSSQSSGHGSGLSIRKTIDAAAMAPVLAKASLSSSSSSSSSTTAPLASVSSQSSSKQVFEMTETERIYLDPVARHRGNTTNPNPNPNNTNTSNSIQTSSIPSTAPPATSSHSTTIAPSTGIAASRTGALSAPSATMAGVSAKLPSSSMSRPSGLSSSMSRPLSTSSTSVTSSTMSMPAATTSSSSFPSSSLSLSSSTLSGMNRSLRPGGTITTTTAPQQVQPQPMITTTRSDSLNATCEAAELDDILMDLGVMDADAEDGTINTRIARRNIDDLFCSPEKADCSIIPSTSRKVSTMKNTSYITDRSALKKTGMKNPRPLTQTKFDNYMNDDVSIIESHNQSMQFINTPFSSNNRSNSANPPTAGGSTFTIFSDSEN